MWCFVFCYWVVNLTSVVICNETSIFLFLLWGNILKFKSAAWISGDLKSSCCFHMPGEPWECKEVGTILDLGGNSMSSSVFCLCKLITELWNNVIGFCMFSFFFIERGEVWTNSTLNHSCLCFCSSSVSFCHFLIESRNSAIRKKKMLGNSIWDFVKFCLFKRLVGAGRTYSILHFVELPQLLLESMCKLRNEIPCNKLSRQL